MNITVTYEQNVQDDKRAEFTHFLAHECDVNVSVNNGAQKPGVKSSGIEIATFIVSSLSVLLSAITLWVAKNPKYSIAVKRGNVTEIINNLNYKKHKIILGKLSEGITDKIEINISES